LKARKDLQQKNAYARQFAAETVIGQEDLVYTTETDLLEAHSAQIDAEWQRRCQVLRSDTTTRDSNSAAFAIRQWRERWVDGANQSYLKLYFTLANSDIC